MLKILDLAAHEDLARELLNHPSLSLVSLKISCSEETAYTVATMKFVKREPQNKKYRRYLKRFIASGPLNPEIDDILMDKNKRLNKQHIFPTKEGTVVVLDYQERKVGQN